MKEQLTNVIDEIIKGMLKDAGVDSDVNFTLVIPEKEEHGDFACNAAMQLVRHLKKNPKVVAEEIISKLQEKMNNSLQCEIAGPGFINIKIGASWYAKTVMDIINNEKYFHNNLGGGKKAMVEFVSANPTGPLHIGHGRGAAYGDSVARLLEMSGYDVLREYYVNDAGNQMNNLALSVYARAAEILGKGAEVPFPEAGYHGDYIIDIAKDLLTTHANILKIDRKEALEICLEKAVQTIQADIDNVKANIDMTELRAPFDGIIGLRQVSLGTYASPSTIVATLTRITPIKIQFQVPERYAKQMKNGTRLSFKVDEQLDAFNAQVYATESSLDNETHKLTVRARYPNTDGKLLPGRYVSIELKNNEIKNAIAIPSEAIVPEMGQNKVFVYRSGLAQPVDVEIGIRTDAEVQILRGLTAGDTIITSGTLQLRMGMPVTLDNIN